MFVAVVLDEDESMKLGQVLEEQTHMSVFSYDHVILSGPLAKVTEKPKPAGKELLS